MGKSAVNVRRKTFTASATGCSSKQQVVDMYELKLLAHT
jgi:hypothetical protein